MIYFRSDYSQGAHPKVMEVREADWGTVRSAWKNCLCLYGMDCFIRGI